METSAAIFRCARCRAAVPPPRQADGLHGLYCPGCAASLRSITTGTPVAVEAPPPPPHTLREHTIEASPEPGEPLPIAPPDPSVELHTRICLNCAHTVDALNPHCAYCGFDARKGMPKKIAETLSHAAPKLCRECGYDLSGLTIGICPECGTKNSLTPRNPLLLASSMEVRKEAYRRPAIMLGAALAVLSVFQLFLHHGDWRYAALYLMCFFTSLPVVVLSYCGCCLAWIGFDMPIHLAALRLAGVGAVALVVYAIFSLLPVWVVPLGLANITYVWMMAHELDMEIQDATVVALLSAVGAAITTLALAGLFGRVLGLIP